MTIWQNIKCELGFHKFDGAETLQALKGKSYRWRYCSNCRSIEVNDDFRRFMRDYDNFMSSKNRFTPEQIEKLWFKK